MGINNDCHQAPTILLGFYPLAGPAKLCETGVKRAARAHICPSLVGRMFRVKHPHLTS